MDNEHVGGSVPNNGSLNGTLGEANVASADTMTTMNKNKHEHQDRFMEAS